MSGPWTLPAQQAQLFFRFPVTCAHSLFPASDVEEAYSPTLELVDSDKEGDSDIEIDWTL